MQVILLETIQKLGGLGDLVNVKSGYARNFLIPNGKVKPATKTNLAAFEIIKAELQAKEAAALDAAKAVEVQMTDTVCVLKVNAGEEGKLFGSINTADIKTSLDASGFSVERRAISMSQTIRHLGDYEVSVALHAQISVAITVRVEASEDD